MLTPDKIAQQTPNLSNPNLLINGDFRIWQRGTSFTGLTTGDYGADRWCAESSNVDIDIVTNSFDVDGNECHGMKVSNDSDSTLMVGQRIEGLQNVTGKTVTVSFEGFSTTASQKLRVYAYYYDNSGVLITSGAVANWVLDTTVAKYQGTITVPDLSASAINGVGSYMKIRVDTQEVSTTDFTLMKFKLEISPVATPFVSRPMAEELALCQRYFEKTYDVGTAPGTVTTTGGENLYWYNAFHAFKTGLRFKVAKRGLPTITFYSAENGTSGVLSQYATNSAFVSDEAILAQDRSNGGFSLYGNNLALANQYTRVHYTADAEL